MCTLTIGEDVCGMGSFFTISNNSSVKLQGLPDVTSKDEAMLHFETVPVTESPEGIFG